MGAETTDSQQAYSKETPICLLYVQTEQSIRTIPRGSVIITPLGKKTGTVLSGFSDHADKGQLPRTSALITSH